MKLGVFVPFDDSIEQRFAQLRSWGVPTCQLSCRRGELCTPANADRLRRLSADAGVEISAMWRSWSGPRAWDFHRGPLTIGIVPRAYRAERMREFLAGAEFARAVGVRDVAAHVGFIPENPSDANYPEVVAAIAFLAAELVRSGQRMLLETGEETPITLERAIDDVGAANVGVNFDPANFLMYGTANPLDALDILGGRVLGVHAKDGDYPSNGKELGPERPLGQGRVDFPRLVGKLKAAGYDGPITIEREIEGPQQQQDIRRAIELLAPLV